MTWGRRGQITDVEIGGWCYDCVQGCANQLRIKATFAIESQQEQAPHLRVNW